MWYLISQLAPFLLLALVIGIVVGWLTSSRAVATDGETTDLIRSENRSGTTFLLILLVAAIIGVLIAVFHFFRGVPGFWWDAIMLLLAAYFIGCVLGCLIRRWFGGFDAMAPATATAALMVTPRLRDPLPGPAPAPAAQPAPAPAAPAPAPVAAPAPAPQPEAPRPAPPAPFPTAPVVWSAPAGADAPAPAPAPVPAAPAPAAPAPVAPAPAPAAYAWGAAYDGARMTLTGTVPSETARTDLVSAARAAFPVAQIRDETTIRAGAPAAFAGLAGIGVAQLGRMVRGSVSIRDTVMSVEGTARTAADRDAVKAALGALPAGARLAFERVGVAAPVEAPAPAAPPPPAAAPEPAPAAAPAPAPVVAFDDDDESIVATRPEGLAAPRDGKKDDLKRIKGIGRVNEAKLNELGIFHFSQIAAWRAEQAKWVNSHLSFPGRIQRENWIAQAHVLAAGGVTEFASRVDRGELDYRPGGANDYSSTGPNRT